MQSADNANSTIGGKLRSLIWSRANPNNEWTLERLRREGEEGTVREKAALEDAGHLEKPYGVPARVKPFITVKPHLNDVTEPVGTIESIALEVAKQFGISLAEMRGESRRSHLVKARHIAFYRAHKELGRSLPQIGRYFGNRDHTTVLHGVRKVENGGWE